MLFSAPPHAFWPGLGSHTGECICMVRPLEGRGKMGCGVPAEESSCGKPPDGYRLTALVLAATALDGYLCSTTSTCCPGQRVACRRWSRWQPEWPLWCCPVSASISGRVARASSCGQPSCDKPRPWLSSHIIQLPRPLWLLRPLMSSISFLPDSMAS